ncbi:MAG: hypothetical protein JNL39_02605 [Opitutaceae bacterium]|nr:hypothetical protein [Opitutaceae bacterium]
MKTYRVLLAAGLFAGAASFLTAGPGPEYWLRASPAKIAKPAASSVTAAAPASTPAPSCSACTCCCEKPA